MARYRLLTVKVDDELRDRLRRASEATGMSMGELVRRALAAYLDSLEASGALGGKNAKAPSSQR